MSEVKSRGMLRLKDSIVLGLSAALAAPAVGGGFHLRYDNETPIRSVDVGGPDQQQRYARRVLV